MKFYLSSFLALIFAANLFSQDIEHVDPPFWWVGMNNPELQIMIHGTDISSYEPSIDESGIILSKVNKVDSENYLFLDISIKTSNPVDFDIVFKKRGKKKRKITYQLREREEGASKRKGFDSSDVIYLITPDRYRNGNPDNDNVKGMREMANRAFHGGRHRGDIEGISQSLDYISDLGFTAIWLNPVLENDMEKYSYHGYSTTDYYKVDPRYGTNEEYRALVQKANKMGVKVIMDHIVNHCGSFHWWMDDLPSNDWINSDNTYVQTTHRRETVQDLYASEYDKKRHSDGWFDRTMPDLNQRNAFLGTYLTQNTIWWIEYLGLSGIRQDTYPYPDKDYMYEWGKAIMDEYPFFNIVGEEWSYNPAIVSYWQGGKVNHDEYVSMLPSVMDFPLQNAIIEALQPEVGEWSEKFANLYRALANDHQYPDPQNLVVFADNHDMSRVFKQVNHDEKMWQMAMAYLTVVRGIPQIYYGTEILMADPDGDHGKIREDYPGGWEGDKTNAFLDDANSGLGDTQIWARNYLKKMLNWRKDKEVIHTGNTMHFAPLFAGRIYTMFRYNDDDMVMLLMNKSDEPAEVEIDKYQEILGEATSLYDVWNEQEISLKNGSISIPGKTALIFEVK